MGTLKFTTTEIEQVLDGRLNSFRQDIADNQHLVGSPQAVLANTEYRLTIDGLNRNSIVAPTYITSSWDTVNNKIAFPEELDSPTYVADMAFTFHPTVSAAGFATIRLYIDDAVPKLIKTYLHDFKSVAATMNILATWYLGNDVGYDAKNDGIYITVSFEAAGNLYNKGSVFYRT